jgi:hypothetical protein
MVCYSGLYVNYTGLQEILRCLLAILGCTCVTQPGQRNGFLKQVRHRKAKYIFDLAEDVEADNLLIRLTKNRKPQPSLLASREGAGVRPST